MVIVIGGGIVGAAAAYRMARAGADVALVDRGDQGQATAAGAGIISPATSIGPSKAFFDLADRAVAHYPELLAQLREDGETDTGYDVVGALFVATSEDELARLPEVSRLVRSRKGWSHVGEVSDLGGAEATALFPPLRALGAVHTTGAARMDGRLLRDAMRRAAIRRGAQVVLDGAELIVSGDRVTGVRLGSGGELAADAVLIAGGAWSPAMVRALGVDLPVAPQRGQIVHLELPGAATGRWPIVVGFHESYMLTFPANRVVAGATRETGSGFDYRLTAGGMRFVLEEALRVAPGLAEATVREWRIGLRPLSRDGLPFLGRLPGVANAYVATGHGPSGLQLGPYSGAAVADLMLGRAPDTDLTPFRPGRSASG
jgi:D-amino-acid dehydrogenase